MQLSKIDLLNRTVYIGFGLLLGLQAAQLWWQPVQSSDNTKSNQTDGNIATYNRIELIAAADEQLKIFIEHVIRDEIKTQLKTATAYSNVDPTRPESHMSETTMIGADENVASVITEKQQQSYQVADQLIEDVILSGNWNSEFADQLAGYLQTLTTDQELAIRVKYANAVNEGWIVPDAPLGITNIQ